MSENLCSPFYRIQVPFPPSITADEIIKKHLEKGVDNANRTSNAFLIYRHAYNREAIKFGFTHKDISRSASKSWRNEPEYVKNHYKKMETDIKLRFREKVPICFVNSQSKRSVRKRRRIADASMAKINQISPTISASSLPHKTMEWNHRINTDVTGDAFTATLSEDLALTYMAIMQSLPF
ncbi:4215_t:CDS:1 [Acaulospora morrowiae]|uniref:4215_t:CDS:1 n=1 Tax=Acaulospora morrowiae TaxID=94023 RepID=A0A9N9FT74_9GLOM|nr:4215_t:CDS:1 [Acaulospora morrowiae]